MNTETPQHVVSLVHRFCPAYTETTIRNCAMIKAGLALPDGSRVKYSVEQGWSVTKESIPAWQRA